MSDARRILAAALIGASTLSSGEIAAKESEMSSADTHAAHAWAGKDTTEYQAIPDIYEWSDAQRNRYTEAAQLRLDQTFARLKPAAVEVCAEETGKHPTVCEHLLSRTKAIVYPLHAHPERNMQGPMHVAHVEKGEPSEIRADARFVNEASTKALSAVVSHEIGHVIQSVPGARGHEEQKQIIRMTPEERRRPEHLAKNHEMEASADMLGGRIARATGVPEDGLSDAWKTVFALGRQNFMDSMKHNLPGEDEKTIAPYVNEIIDANKQSYTLICGRIDRLRHIKSGAGWYPCLADRHMLFAGEIPKGYESLAGPTRKQSFFSKLMNSFFQPATDAVRAPRQDSSAKGAPSSSTVPGASHSRPTSAKQADTLAYRVPLPSQRASSIERRNRAMLDEHRER